MDLYEELEKIVEGIDADKTSKEIAVREWNMFQQVQNAGGRASCQENPHTFAIMRISQAMSWSQEARESYINDLKQAEQDGRNLLTEKYARMMKSTFPQEYARIEASLPPLSDEAKEMVEELTALLVNWAEESKKKYPYISGSGRPIHTVDDVYGTSIETYSRGELSTYSLNTLRLLKKHYLEQKEAGVNIHMKVEENTAHFYGYKSLEDAEEAQRRYRTGQN